MPRRKDRPYNLVNADCSSGKTAWKSERSAHRAARIASSEAPDSFRAYLCPECGHYHLTGNTRMEPVTPPSRPLRPLRGTRPARGQTVADLARQMREGE